MRGKDLLECMEYIEDALVEEALEPMVFPRRNNTVTKWGMAAACVLVISISATAFWSHQGSKEERIENTGDTASPIIMDHSDADRISEGSLAAGAIPEDPPAGVNDAGGSDNSALLELCELPTVEDLSGAGSGSARGNDAVSQNSAADAASITDNIAAKDQEKEVKTEAAEQAEKISYTVISSYYGEKDDSIYDYPVPEKGKFFCYHDLQKTINYYDGQENTAENTNMIMYAYDVAIDLYGDISKEGSSESQYGELCMDHSSASSERIEQEYQRLTELGYTVRLSEDFQLSGIFTGKELAAFQASPEYGYTFRFADEN